MGALVVLSLIAAIPACVMAAVYWAGVSVEKSAELNAHRLVKAARWTALALILQGVSLLATVLLAFSA